jgi:hypothetical protein
MPSVTLHVVEFTFLGGFESLPLRQTHPHLFRGPSSFCASFGMAGTGDFDFAVLGFAHRAAYATQIV